MFGREDGQGSEWLVTGNSLAPRKSPGQCYSFGNSTRARTFPADIVRIRTRARRRFSGFSTRFLPADVLHANHIHMYTFSFFPYCFTVRRFSFSFDNADHVYGSRSSTADIYKDVVRPVIESVLQGFNGTRVYSYDQFLKKKYG